MRSLPLRSASAPGGRRATRVTGYECRSGYVRESEARIVRSRPPNVQPAARPNPSGPSADPSLQVIMAVARGSRPEGPDGSGVNGLTPGPLRLLLGRLPPAGQGACRKWRTPPSPSMFTIRAPSGFPTRSRYAVTIPGSGSRSECLADGVL
jgi:hypothetical protein